jgi:hypothetical protein
VESEEAGTHTALKVRYVSSGAEGSMERRPDRCWEQGRNLLAWLAGAKESSGATAARRLVDLIAPLLPHKHTVSGAACDEMQPQDWHSYSQRLCLRMSRQCCEFTVAAHCAVAAAGAFMLPACFVARADTPGLLAC